MENANQKLNNEIDLNDKTGIFTVEVNDYNDEIINLFIKVRYTPIKALRYKEIDYKYIYVYETIIEEIYTDKLEADLLTILEQNIIELNNIQPTLFKTLKEIIIEELFIRYKRSIKHV